MDQTVSNHKSFSHCGQGWKSIDESVLLNRKTNIFENEEIHSFIHNKIVLVTGAGGSIGSELCRQLLISKPRKLLLLGHGENSIFEIENELHELDPDIETETLIYDIQDYEGIYQIFYHYAPSVVFHTAAHKHVTLMERNPRAAILNNLFGTINVANAADQTGTSKMVMISTDKAVNPVSVMGITKRLSELYVKGLDHSSKTCFAIVRFGNVLGSRGSVYPLWLKQIQSGGPVTITHPDMERYFLTIPEAVQLALIASKDSKGGGGYVLNMGERVKIIDLVHRLIWMHSLEVGDDIEIKITGSREGEKIVEELLISKDHSLSKSDDDRIFVETSSFDREGWELLLRKLSDLKDLLGSNQSTVDIKGEIVDILEAVESYSVLY